MKLWIIESRNEKGELLFRDKDGNRLPQPEEFFGIGAISGMTDWEMSRPIFRKIPNATLDGGSIPLWPKLINSNWIARRKTWPSPPQPKEQNERGNLPSGNYEIGI